MNVQNVIEGTKKKKLLSVLSAAGVILIAVIAGIAVYNTPANRLSRQMDLGNKYLEEGSYEQAVIAFDLAIAIDPMSAEAYIGKAGAYVGMNDYAQAAEVYQTAFAAVPESAALKDAAEVFYRDYAQEYVDSGDLEQAAAVYKEALRIIPDSETIKDMAEKFYFDYAQGYIDDGDYEQAIRILEEGYDLTGRESLRKRAEELSDEAEKKQAEMEEVRQTVENIANYYEWLHVPFKGGIINAGGHSFDDFEMHLTDAEYEEVSRPVLDMLEQYMSYYGEGYFAEDMTAAMTEAYGEDKDPEADGEGAGWSWCKNYYLLLARLYYNCNEYEKCKETIQKAENAGWQRVRAWQESSGLVTKEYDEYGRWKRRSYENYGIGGEGHCEMYSEFGENGRINKYVSDVDYGGGHTYVYTRELEYDAEGRVISDQGNTVDSQTGSTESSETYVYHGTGYTAIRKFISADGGFEDSSDWERKEKEPADPNLPEYGSSQFAYTFGDGFLPSGMQYDTY